VSIPAAWSSAPAGAAVPAPAGGGRPLEDYRRYCAGLDRGADARSLRLRQASRFLAAHPDLNAWMTRPVEVRLADLRRFKAWPLLTFAVLSGLLRLDAGLLASRRLGGFGRCAEEQFAGQFAALREAAARLAWGPRHIEAVIRQGVVTAIAFTGKPPAELTTSDLDDLDAQIAASPRLSAAERHRRHKLARGVRELLYEARIIDTPAGSGRTSVRAETRLAAAVDPPEIRRAMTADLAARSAQLRPGSITGMANDLACFGEFLHAAHPGLTSLSELTRDHIEEFTAFARTRGYRGHRAGESRTVGPSAAAHTMITLRCFLDDITAWGWAQAPPRRLVFGSDIPRQPRLLPRALPADIDAALMDAVTRHPDPFARAGLVIMRGTGLRIGELLDLELDCVVDYGTTGSWLRVPLGKLATERAVPLDEGTLACLDALIRHRGPQRALPHPRLGRDADFVFAEGGRRVVPGRLRRALQQAAADAGLAGTDGQPLRVVPHQLRHTYATTLANAGLSLPALMALLGHQTPEMTLRYATLATPTLRTAYETAMGKMRRQFTLTPAGRPIVPDKVAWLSAEMLKTRLAHGYCSRDPAAGACPYANICENCDNFVPADDAAPVLQAQLHDISALRDDASQRGWDSEAARHARAAASISGHLRNIGAETDIK
jgi:integrase